MGSKRIEPESARKLMIAAGVKPIEPFKTSSEPWDSICLNCGRKVSPSYGNVRNGHAACKYCSGKAVLASDAVEIMLSAKAKPLIDFPGAKEHWLCECLLCGREIQAVYNVAKRAGVACNFCKKRRVDSGEAEKTMRAADLAPLVPYKSVHTRWESECLRCGRIVFPSFQKVRLRGHQCQWCSGVKISEIDAVETMLRSKAKPRTPYPGANNPWTCECLVCGREISPKLSVVSSGVGACKFCAKRAVEPSEAFSEMLRRGVEPLEIFPGAVKPWRSRCLTCLREVSPAYSNVSNGHSPCVYCSKKKVDPEIAFEVAISRALQPLEPFPGAVIPWQMKCMKCGQITETTWTILNVKRLASGCSSCTPYGFKPNLESYFYIISHEHKQALKVGISNVESGRLAKHQKNGWEIHHLLKFETGVQAKELETKMLHQLRRVERLPPAFTVGDGWTETIPYENQKPKRLFTLARRITKNKFKIIKPNQISSRD